MNRPTPIDWSSLDDQAVVQHAMTGDPRAQRELIERYQRPIHALIHRMVRDRELAEDLAQETFVKVLNALDSYRPEYRFSSWIFKIANNAAIDHLRRRQLETLSLDGSPHAATGEAIEATTLQIGDNRPSPLEEVAHQELGRQIGDAVALLRPEYRSCILLRHVEGRTYEEIAEILDLPLGTVKTYIHRARHELRLHLAGVRDQ